MTQKALIEQSAGSCKKIEEFATSQLSGELMSRSFEIQSRTLHTCSIPERAGARGSTSAKILVQCHPPNFENAAKSKVARSGFQLLRVANLKRQRCNQHWPKPSQYRLQAFQRRWMIVIQPRAYAQTSSDGDEGVTKEDQLVGKEFSNEWNVRSIRSTLRSTSDAVLEVVRAIVRLPSSSC